MKTSLLLLSLMLCVGTAWADQVSNQPPQKSTRPVVNISRVSWDDRGTARGPSTFSIAGAQGVFDKARGTVWWQNTSDETLSKVQLVVHFYNYESYRDAGATKTYQLGTVDGHKSQAVDYEWLNSEGERVYPWVELRWIDGSGQAGRTVANPFSY